MHGLCCSFAIHCMTQRKKVNKLGKPISICITPWKSMVTRGALVAKKHYAYGCHGFQERYENEQETLRRQHEDDMQRVRQMEEEKRRQVSEILRWV